MICILAYFVLATLKRNTKTLTIGIISAGARLNDKGEVEVASLEFKKPEPVKPEPVKVEEKKPEPVKEPVKAEEKKPEPVVKTEVPKMKK